MDPTAYHLVTLAGLMHDLGKLVRTQQLDRQQRQPYGRANRRQGHHAADGVNFLAHIGADQHPGWPLLDDIIRHHHPDPDRDSWQPDNRPYGQIVHMADIFSSYERVEVTRDSTDRPQLESIFRQVTSVYTTPDPQYYRATALEPSSAFPQTQTPSFARFNDLVDQLEDDLRQLFANVTAPDHLTVAVTELMAQYATATNADKRTFPFDVSLFDHLTTTAAIAASLYLYHAANDTWSDAALEDQETDKFLLIGCDLSGIQAYLYEIAQIGSGGVAKRLRARSFYLTALLDVIAFRLCQELVADLDVTLPLNCVVVKSGGRFLLLAPNLPGVHAQLAAIDRDVNQWLRTETHGDLACYFTAKPLAGRDFITEHALADTGENPPGASSITRRIDEVYQALNQAKQRRYYDLLYADDPNLWQDVFVQRAPNVHYPPGDGVTRGGACRSCRKLPVDPAVTAARAARGDPTPLCRRCAEDITLGRRLLDVRYLAYRRGDAPAAADRLHLRFFTGQHRYTLALAATAAALTDFDAAYVEHLSLDPQCFAASTDYAADLAGARRTGYLYPVRRRRLANYVPAVADDIVPFDDLAQRVGRPELAAQVEPRLGVLKMDVDQLGLLIAEGLGRVTSISRVATFSRMLDLFFSGWIDVKLRRPYLHDEDGNLLQDAAGDARPNPYRDVYTVYAGGDDLLLVGPWDRTVDLARELAQDFHRYTNRNDNLTISAAVNVVKPGYPVARSAQEAGRLLDDYAKALGRNRFYLFGVVAPWRRRTPQGIGNTQDPSPEEAMRLALDDNQAVTMDQIWDWAEFFDDQLYLHRQSVAADGPRYPISNIMAHRVLRLSTLSANLLDKRSAHIDDLTYMAQLAYLVGRNASAKRFEAYYGKESYASHYTAVTGRLMQLTQWANADLMACMRMPLTWALYRNRQRSENHA
ncbi:MAG: type III-A CRISPR-associated protein Cas10/Csm1 [Caldilineaceae bacterium]|nr:type III-A CRISPR-associated protein Cas10/Csm1 [Caldilineaceae bacterium]